MFSIATLIATWATLSSVSGLGIRINKEDRQCGVGGELLVAFHSSGPAAKRCADNAKLSEVRELLAKETWNKV